MEMSRVKDMERKEGVMRRQITDIRTQHKREAILEV